MAQLPSGSTNHNFMSKALLLGTDHEGSVVGLPNVLYRAAF
jgi:hypothetical protein